LKTRASRRFFPRSNDRSLTLARRYSNGEECLPFIQNIQDYLEYAEKHGTEVNKEWNCTAPGFGPAAHAVTDFMPLRNQ
jgi:predicted nucleotide-binding protein (sugar kinase/HSP70/actin superfamily)